MRNLLLAAGLLFACAFAVEAQARVVPNAPVYFPVLPFDAPPDMQPMMVPVAMSKVLDNIQTGVRRAIIVVHDESRDANAAIAAISSLAGAASSSILILAPQFLIPSDLVLIAKQLPAPTRTFAVWSPTGWPLGEESATNAATKGISSFTVLDTTLMFLNNSYMFPALESIIVVGYGTSANFVHRYAELGVAPQVLKDANLDVRFIVAGASSYLYPTANRPLGPSKGFGRPDTTACPDYNAYPYGLEKLNNYGKRVGSNAVKVSYPARFVTYLVPGQGELISDDSCSAKAQGANPVERMKSFRTYLSTLYDTIVMQRHIFWTSPDMKADPISIFGSPCGMSALFGDGICEGLRE